MRILREVDFLLKHIASRFSGVATAETSVAEMWICASSDVGEVIESRGRQADSSKAQQH